MPGLFEELKRRNVFKVGTAYVVLAWLLAQVTDVFLENFGAPDWVIKTVLLLLIVGFPLVLLFAWAYELTPEGLKKEKDVDRSQSITHQTGQKLNLAIIFILLLALGYFAVDKFLLEPARHTDTAQAAAPEPETQAARSIAVLPFVNMSEDPGNEYFSDGISEEILNSLARVGDLKVAGRTSSFAFKGQNQDLRQIGGALGVEHILEGSVRKAGTRVRITAQLIQVEDGFHLWSETYDRELTDVFAIQDEIANAILQQLKARLLDGVADTAVVAKRTGSEAYDLYLLARQRLYERTGPTIESAAELLDRAIALDSQYAPAYALRGIAALLLDESSYGDIPRDQSLSQGRLYVDRSLQLDPSLAEGWAGLGLYHVNRPGENRQAIEALEKALAINPNLIDASNWLHSALTEMGRPAEARRVVLDMIRRDPLYPPGIRNAINAFNSFGEYEEALAFLERVRLLLTNDATLLASTAAVLLEQGRKAEGTRLIEQAVALQPSNSVARLSRSEAWLATQQLERAADEGEHWPQVYALALLGRTEEAAILAWRRADERADVFTLLGFLNVAGRSAEAVAYIEQRWPDLEAFERDYPPYGGFGHIAMFEAALAYSRTGNAGRFDQAMARIRRAHDELQAQGVDNPSFFMIEASYHVLAGDFESALDWLDRAIARGHITATPRIAREWVSLAPLEGDPRFEAIQSRMIEHLNAERAALGLEPVEA